jgi:hypothetical protein
MPEPMAIGEALQYIAEAREEIRHGYAKVKKKAAQAGMR